MVKFVLLWRLGVFGVYFPYLLTLKFYGIDIPAIRVLVGFVVVTLAYWILNKKGLLGFASSEKKIDKLRKKNP